MELTANGADWTADGVLFEYRSPLLTSISPSHGPLDGHTAVSLHGVGFTPADTVEGVSCLPTLGAYVVPMHP